MGIINLVVIPINLKGKHIELVDTECWTEIKSNFPVLTNQLKEVLKFI